MSNYLLVASHNQGKVVELNTLLADKNITCLILDDLDIQTDIEETGNTFRENAILKATSYAKISGHFTLADDSGLEVDALNGQPGILTARYGGEGLTPKERYEFLLKNLMNVSWENRMARFKSVIALAGPDGAILGIAKGVCEGIIATEPAGSGGFGYDPVFYLPEWGTTMAQLDPITKHQISHRGRAIRIILPTLREFLSQAQL